MKSGSGCRPSEVEIRNLHGSPGTRVKNGRRVGRGIEKKWGEGGVEEVEKAQDKHFRDSKKQNVRRLLYTYEASPDHRHHTLFSNMKSSSAIFLPSHFVLRLSPWRPGGTSFTLSKHRLRAATSMLGFSSWLDRRHPLHLPNGASSPRSLVSMTAVWHPLNLAVWPPHKKTSSRGFKGGGRVVR